MPDTHGTIVIVVKDTWRFVDPDTGSTRRYIKLENALESAARITRWAKVPITIRNKAGREITVDVCAYENGQQVWTGKGFVAGFVSEPK